MIDATGMPQSAVVIGATSDIARETIRLLASRRLRSLLLTSRSEGALEVMAEELRAVGVASVETARLDVTAVGELDDFARRAFERLGEIDLVLVAPGDLGTADLNELDGAGVAASAAVNFVGPAAASLAFAKVLKEQGYGRIVILSSAAGVRVRKANFVYGAGKAGLDGFALGLGDALVGSGVQVIVVRPGFVRTKMTAGRPSAPLSVGASDVAAAIVRGMETGREVVWAPAVLGPIFGVLRLLPRVLWRHVPA